MLADRLGDNVITLIAAGVNEPLSATCQNIETHLN